MWKKQEIAPFLFFDGGGGVGCGEPDVRAQQEAAQKCLYTKRRHLKRNETGLKDPKFKEILESAQKEMPEYGKDFKSYMDLIPEDKRSDKAKDPITPEKLKEALALLEMMEKLKS